MEDELKQLRKSIARKETEVRCTDEALVEAGVETLERMKLLQGELAELRKQETILLERAQSYSPSRYSTLLDFLREYRLLNSIKLGLMPPSEQEVSRQDLDVKFWDGFEPECAQLLLQSPQLQAQRDGPFTWQRKLPVADHSIDSVFCLVQALSEHLYLPLQHAWDSYNVPFYFEPYGLRAAGVTGLPERLLLSKGNNRLLAVFEVETSAVLDVPDGDLVGAYAAASAKLSSSGNASETVPEPIYKLTQLYRYLKNVPYGVLVTEQQLFCMMREGSTLYCSRGIPLTGSVRVEAGSASVPLTAVGTIHCIALMASSWQQRQERVQQGQEPTQLPLHTAELPPLVSESHPVSESYLKYEDVFPATGGPFLAETCTGVVRVGCIRGQAAAVTVVDLYKDSSDRIKHEAAIYERLRPLQGVCIPRLLAYGYLDGWQYFLATSLEGPALSEKDWPLDKLKTVKSALRALDEVHRLGVRHGDLALSNLVFSRRRSDAPPRVMVTDFGKAKLAADAAADCVRFWGQPPTYLDRNVSLILAGEKSQLREKLWLRVEEDEEDEEDVVEVEEGEAEAEVLLGQPQLGRLHAGTAGRGGEDRSRRPGAPAGAVAPRPPAVRNDRPVLQPLLAPRSLWSMARRGAFVQRRLGQTMRATGFGRGLVRAISLLAA